MSSGPGGCPSPSTAVSSRMDLSVEKSISGRSFLAHATYSIKKLHPTSVDFNTSPLLSPSGESITALNYSAVQLWRTSGAHSTGSPITSLSSVPTKPAVNLMLDFFPDETLAAAVRLREIVITVLDLESGHPALLTGDRWHGHTAVCIIT